MLAGLWKSVRMRSEEERPSEPRARTPSLQEFYPQLEGPAGIQSRLLRFSAKSEGDLKHITTNRVPNIIHRRAFGYEQRLLHLHLGVPLFELNALPQVIPQTSTSLSRPAPHFLALGAEKPRPFPLPSLPATAGAPVLGTSSPFFAMFPETFRSVEVGHDASFVSELLGKRALLFEVINSRTSSSCFARSQPTAATDKSSALYRWQERSATVLG